MGTALAQWEVAKWPRRKRMRVGRSSALLILSAQFSPSLPSECSCFRTLRWRVAAEWALGVRVVMAGYEYVSPEQLAGFDKYKVARAPWTPLSLLGPASPRRLRSWRGPCHLVRRGSGRAGRRFFWSPAETWGFGVGVRGSTVGPPPRLGTLPRDRLFLRRPLGESGAREFLLLLYFIIIIF